MFQTGPHENAKLEIVLGASIQNAVQIQHVVGVVGWAERNGTVRQQGL